MLKRIILLFAVFLLSYGVSYAQLGGTYDYQITQTISSARAAALGGNATSLRDGDINLALYNPALLDSTTHNQLALGYNAFLADAGYGHAIYGRHYEGVGNFAASLQFISYGEFDQTDVFGQQTGTFSAGEYLFTLHGSRRLDSLFNLGANVKFIYSELAEYKSSAIAIDLAAHYRSLNGLFMAALVVRNAGLPISHYRDGMDEKLPFEVQLSSSYKLANAPFRFHFALENLQQWDLTPEEDGPVELDPLTGEPINEQNDGFGENLMRHLVTGVEIIISDNFHLRGGYNYYRRTQLALEDRPGGAGFSMGAGFRINKFHLTYARSFYNQAGNNNHFGVMVRLNDFKEGS